jgi:hypothetical protein
VDEFFFCGTADATQGLELARQATYHEATILGQLLKKNIY